MAQQVLGLVGAVVGGMIGGPMGSAALGSALGSALGGYVGMGIDTAGIVNHGPRLDDRRVQSSANGIPITRGFGTIKTTGNIVQSRDIEEVPKKQKAGKGNQATTVTYSYYWTGIIAVHDGQVAAFRKVFANKKLVGDKSEGNTGAPGDIFNYLRFYDGSNEQQIDPISLSDYGESALAYTNRACVVVDRLPLADSYNQIPTFEFEIIITEDNVNLTQTTTLEQDFVSGKELSFARLFYEKDSPEFIALRRFQTVSTGVQAYKFYKYDSRTYELLSVSNELNLPFLVSQDKNYCNLSRTNEGLVMFSGLLIGQTMEFFNADGLKTGEIDIWNSTKDEHLALRKLYPLFKKSFPVGDRNHFMAMTREFSINNENTYIVGSFNKSGEFTYQKKTLENSIVYNTENELGAFSNGVHYFITSSNSRRLSYLSTSIKENAFLLNNQDESGYLMIVRDMFFDEATKKVFILFSKSVNSSNSNTYLMRVDLVANKQETIQISASSDNNKCLNFDEVNRLFFMYKRNTNLIDNYIHIKLDSLEIRRFDVSRSSINYHSAESYIPAFYNTLAQSYVYISDRNDPGLNKTALIIYNGNRAKDGFMKLSKVIQSLIKDTSLTNNDIDVSELEDVIVKGYKLTNANQISAVIEQLAQIYSFEIVDSTDKLRFIKSKREISRVIEEEELGARFKSNNAFDLLLDETRTQDIELPRTLTISYMDKDKDYEINTQESKRVIDSTQQSVNYQFPIVLNSDEAFQLADRMMYTAWTQRKSYSFDLNNSHADLEPGDVVQVNANGTSYIIKINEILSNQGINKIKGVSYDNSVYVQNGKGNTGLIDNEVLEIIAGTNVYFLDIPIFAESDNNFGIYVTVDKSSKGKWRGAGVYEIEDLNTPDAATFIESFAARTTAGTANTSKLRNFGGNMIDYLSSVVVTLNDEDDELEGCSYEDLIQKDLNVCVIGNEIVQFMHAEFISAKTYKISMLLRNRLSHQVEHVDTERFVLMDFANGSLKRFDKELKIFNTTKSYKAITTKAYTAPIVSATNTCVGQKPLQVCDVVSGKNGNGDLLLKFTKRVRGQLPLTDNFEGADIDGDFYEIDIFKNESLVRTVALTETNFNYSKSMQIDDNTVNQPINFHIYKINKNFGRGFEYVHKIL